MQMRMKYAKAASLKINTKIKSTNRAIQWYLDRGNKTRNEIYKVHKSYFRSKVKAIFIQNDKKWAFIYVRVSCNLRECVSRESAFYGKCNVMSN